MRPCATQNFDFFFAFIFWKMRHHEIFGSLKGLPLNSFEIYGMGSRCPKKRWKTQFLKVLFYVFSCKTLVWKRDISIIFNWNQHNLKFEHCRLHAKWCKMHIFKRYTCKINLQFRAFYSIFLGALSSGALSYRDISGNIRVKYQFENATSRQFSIEISIFSSLNNGWIEKSSMRVSQCTAKQFWFFQISWVFSRG